MRIVFISIHAAQEGCDAEEERAAAVKAISIHAAQEGCDLRGVSVGYRVSISIHAAQEGCDQRYEKYRNQLLEFQSTQPKRAATTSVALATEGTIISIHAAQEGCDYSCL